MKKILTICLLACLGWGIQAQDFSVKSVYVYDDVSTTPPHKVSNDSIVVLDTVSFGVNLFNVGSQILGGLDSAGFRFRVNGTDIGTYGRVGFNNIVPSTGADVTLTGNHVFTTTGQFNVCAIFIYSSVGRGGNLADDSLCKTFTVAPPAGVKLTSFAPSEGYRGSQVALNGFRFDATASANVVKLNGVNCTVDSATTTRLVVTVPATATSGVFSVTTGGQTSTSTNTYTVHIPKINSFSPDSGFVSDTVKIMCSDLISRPTVRFSATKCNYVIWTADTVWAEVPTGATSGKIKFEFGTTDALSANDFIVKVPKDTSKDTTSVQTFTKIQGRVWQNGNVISFTEMQGNYDLKIVDMNGKTHVKQSVIIDNKSQIVEVEISSLHPGVYIAVFNNSYFKFVKTE